MNPLEKDNSKPDGKSTVARAYTVKHVPEMWEKNQGFRDARGRGYTVAPDGSLRAATKPMSREKRRRLEREQAKAKREGR